MLSLISSFFSWSDLPSLQQGRLACAATVLPDGAIVVAGGLKNREDFLSSVELLPGPVGGGARSGGKGWRPLPPLLQARAYHGLAALNDALVVAGGRGDGGWSDLSTAELLSPLPTEGSRAGAGQWTRIASLSRITGWCGLVSHADRLFAYTNRNCEC